MLEPCALRADVELASWRDEDRSVEVTWTAGADVLRYDYRSDQLYWERLDFSADAVDLGRLNSGRAPVLDAHSSYSGTDVVGNVMAGSARVDAAARKGTARLRFTAQPDAAPIVGRIKDGTLGSVSFGYKRLGIEKTSELVDGKPVWIVRKWEPFEISPVPIPADAGAGFRGAPQGATLNPCEVLRSADMPPETVTTKTPAEIAADAKREADRIAAEKAAADAAIAAAAEAARSAERERIAAIRVLCRAHRVAPELEAELVDKGRTLEQARAAILDSLASRDDEVRTSAGGARVTEAEEDKVRAELFAGLELRGGRPVAAAAQGDLARSFRGMRSVRIAAWFLERQGVRCGLMSDVDIARRAFHSTSDFPQALANVQNKTLRAAYERAPRTFEPFTTRVGAPDFKPVSRVSGSGLPQLTRVYEGGEIQDGIITDAAQGYSLAKYGKAVATTWESLINDDLDFIGRQLAMGGAAVSTLEGDLVYAVITTPQVMDETGLALFHSTHANLATGAPAVDKIAGARALMRNQTSPNGDRLNLEGRLLMGGSALEITLRQYMAQIVPETAGNANPLVDLLRGVVSDARLPATKWWLLATPDQIDMIELCSLTGAEPIIVETEMDFRTKGMTTSYLAVRAAAAIDYRGFVESSGA